MTDPDRRRRVISTSAGLTLGGISRRAAVVDGRIEPREILDVTLSFDHEIVDGAPAVPRGCC